MDTSPHADDARPKVQHGNFVQSDDRSIDLVDSPIAKQHAPHGQADEEDDIDDIAQSVATISTAFTQK